MEGMDEEFAVAFNDVDFCLRVRRCTAIRFSLPLMHSATITEFVSRGADTSREKKERFERERQRLKNRFGDSLLHDPFYNPNLTLDMEDFSESKVLP